MIIELGKYYEAKIVVFYGSEGRNVAGVCKYSEEYKSNYIEIIGDVSSTFFEEDLTDIKELIGSDLLLAKQMFDLFNEKHS